jgi:hypothetical protein
MDADRRFYRLVIGSYATIEQCRLACTELGRSGIDATQMCLIGPDQGLRPTKRAMAAAAGEESAYASHCALRLIGGHFFTVSSPPLFDRLWQEHDHCGHPMTGWMTQAQSSVIWKNLKANFWLLLIDAGSADQQVRCSQIQLNHHRPALIQAYHFAL